ncbi:MAG: tyrosine-type recombinase/integrase [Erysipelotrichaceae bacterium]|nr:tyrosine-type recombinase/integrase [Erysipelotrichaceae bacterium]
MGIETSYGVFVSGQFNYTKGTASVPFILPTLLSFQGSTHLFGVGSFSYITIERPKSKDPHLFLSYNHPFGPISSGAINGVSNLIYKAANIRQSPGDRKGNHLFRHNLATLLLENGTDKAIISNVLGHSDPCSTEAYLSADTIHLKQCALSVETYPMKREVLNRE